MKYSLDTHSEQYRSLLLNVMGVLLDEDELLMQMTAAAETPLSDEELQTRFPQLWQHFQYDPEAEEAYRLLLMAEQTDIMGILSSTDETESSLESSILGLWKQVSDTISELIFPGFDLVAAGAFRGGAMTFRGQDFRVSPTRIDAPNGDFEIQIDLTTSTEDEDTYLLICKIAGTDPDTKPNVAHSPAQIIVEPAGAIEDEQPWQDGTVAFDELPAGKYTFQFSLDTQVYKIKGIDLQNIANVENS
ncbi:MAG: hypothetical protein AAF702_18680 [Chloroflexota bacterium]